MKDTLRRAYQILIAICLWPWLYWTSKTDNQEALLKVICKKIETKRIFPSFRLRRKNTCDTPILFDLCKNDERKIGIVLQGPIASKDELTLNSIRYYKKLYPDSIIVLSTWKSEDRSDIQKCAELGAIVVQSDLPNASGVLNVNYQIVSSLAGISKAIELGASYIAKTRTDQRVCKPYVFYALINLLEKYPIMGENTHMENRLVVMPTYVHNMFTPYFMSDFFYFGKAHDIRNLFSVALDTRENYKPDKLNSRLDYCSAMYPPEIYLLKNYLKNYAEASVTDSIKDYWQCVKCYLLCVDKSMLDLLITKYDYCYNDGVSESTYFSSDDCARKLTMKWGFVEWLNLINEQIVYREEYEKERNQAFN